MTNPNTEASEQNAGGADPASFEDIMSKLDEKYDGWERSRQALYHILGYMFEAAALIDRDVRLQAQLTSAVKKRPDVRASKRWKPDKVTTIEQLLALRFGITGPEMGLKSNWLKTLRAALDVTPPLPRTETAFVEWITGVGGEEKARTQGANAERIVIAEFSEAVGSDEALAGIEFELPDGLELLNGLAVILVREVEVGEGEHRRAKAVEIVTRKRTVEAVATAVVKGWDRDFKAGLSELHRDRKWAVLHDPRGAPQARPDPHYVPGPGNFRDPDDIKQYRDDQKAEAKFARGSRRKKGQPLLPHEIDRMSRGKANLDEQIVEETTGDASLSGPNETAPSSTEVASRVAVVEPEELPEDKDRFDVLAAEEESADPA